MCRTVSNFFIEVSFRIFMSLNRSVDVAKRCINIFFSIGSNPKPGKGTHVQCLLSPVGNPNGWAAILRGRQQRKTEAVVAITTPPDCIVGDWDLTIENVVQQDKKPQTFTYRHPSKLYILFNPWCKGRMR